MHTTTTTKGATTMTVDEMMLIQIAAAERLEAAQRMVRVAEVRIDALVHDAPLRYKVEDSRRLRAAYADLEAAQAAWDAAQDIDCPDAEL